MHQAVKHMWLTFLFISYFQLIYFFFLKRRCMWGGPWCSQQTRLVLDKICEIASAMSQFDWHSTLYDGKYCEWLDVVGTGISSDTCACANLEDDSPLRLDDGNTADEPLSNRCDRFLISVTDFKLNDISLDANDIDRGDAWSNEPTVSANGMENVTYYCKRYK